MKFEKISFKVFAIFFGFAVFFSYVVNSSLFDKPEKPWHMQPFNDEDNLSLELLDSYEVFDTQRLSTKFADSTRKNVLLLVDAWGVPFDTEMLEKEFDIFSGIPHKAFLHARIANRTRHAEFAELRNPFDDGVYLFGGDSVEYGRNLYADSIGYSEKIFCQHCDDSLVLDMLDSVIRACDKRIYAMTTQSSRKGEIDRLHRTLEMIATVAKKHSQVRFIVQGTHRPILGSPEIRKQHYAKWVPAIVLN